jgi:hypothetical protein
MSIVRSITGVTWSTNESPTMVLALTDDGFQDFPGVSPPAAK